ncbi:MAG: carboxypeptidase regulatory-like domain-containing protein, partial [Vicinamibacterales bacterium]
MKNLPVGTQYRDVIKLLPGVQYTENQVIGPSSGSSGQDNVYKFDGVNVTLPLFGTLSAEPAAYDIAEVTVVKGGAKAVDFDRAGGFLVNSISKSGTNKLTGDASFRFRTASMAAAQVDQLKQYDQTNAWTDLDAGGPIVPNRLFFYGSYYRPTVSHANSATAYGSVPDFKETRNEGYGKVTYTPLHNALINASYRDSNDVQKGASFGAFSSSTTGTGNQGRLRIFDSDGNWILNNSSFITAKFQHFGNLTEGRPDNTVATPASIAIGSTIDTAHLDQLGLLTVPKLGSDATVNAFLQPIINQYGFQSNGVATGGGTVGDYYKFDQDNFFRTSGEVAYNLTVSGKGMRHNIHAGFQRYIDSEDLLRSSNGLGLLTVPGGGVSFQGTPIFYEAAFQQQGFGPVSPVIHSEYHSNDIELNDEINWKDWTFNVGLLASHDTIWGQGLQNDSSALSGFVASTATTSAGRKYEEYSIPFTKMLQPRLSATWAYNSKGTIYGSYAVYNPSANSDARAASWDRNLEKTINAYYD